MPALNYVSNDSQNVSVTYTDMPPGTDAVFVNQVSGAKTPSPSGALSKGGSGSAQIPTFACASAAVYFINDVVDVERDRRHPVKRNRPIASGALPERHAVVLAVLATAVAVGAGLVIREPLVVLTVVAYLCESFLYSFRLKHVPFVEMVLVASGFLLRVLGGAAATHVPPSGWFLVV